MPPKNEGPSKSRTGPETVYDAEGNWTVFQHQDKLRTLNNKLFNTYYRDVQKLVPEDRWDAFLADIRRPLPTTVWINDTDPLAAQVSAYFKSLDPGLVEPIAWYPVPGMAWRILADKALFRKLPEMQPLRTYLIRQTALGTVSRQEEVSMIPTFLLGIQPSDMCLDMCASPGSKTAQMLVALGRHKVVQSISDSSSAPASTMSGADSPFPFDYLSPGLIMANELDTKRANMLVHQCKRLRLLFPFALFCNHDARFFPDLVLSDGRQNAVAATEQQQGTSPSTCTAPPPVVEEEVRFDKILCDVVCSGDGTIRKAPFIFKIWSPKEAIGLQRIQVQIALRACHLLKVGGRLVYSTCSLNPIENEAVVVQIAARTNGAMRLVDARSMLPSLACDPGMTTWSVTNNKGVVVEEPSEHFHEALFPPKAPVPGLDLELCMRLLPHHCNGGGFFIAVFDKVAEYRIVARQDDDEVKLQDGATAAVAPPKRPRNDDRAKKPRGRQPGQGGAAKELETGASGDPNEPVVEAPSKPKGPIVPPQFFPATDDMVKSLSSFYQIPNFPCKNLVVRAGTGEKRLTVGINTTASLVSNSAAKVLRGKKDNLVVVSAGLRVLAHEHLDKGWRVTAEAATLFATLMRDSERVLRVDLAVMERLMSGGKLKEILIVDLEEGPFREKVENLAIGTLLLEIECPTAPSGLMYSVALRARSRLQLLVDHEDLVGLRLRLGMNVAEEEASTVEAAE